MNRLALFALLAVVVILAGVGIYFGTRDRKKPDVKAPQIEEVKKREVMPVPKVAFTDWTAKSGVTFKHVNGAFGLKLLPETMGSGCAFIDFDNDGHQDLVFVNGRPWPGDSTGTPATLALYRSKGDGTFEDVTGKMGLAISVYGQGVCVGDFDNDGFADLFISAVGGNLLLRNDGGKKFVDVTAQTGVAGGSWPGISRDAFLALDKPIPWPSSATFVDFDGDGRLDLFVCHYVTWAPKLDLDNKFTLNGKTRAYGPPRSFEGSQCTLYRNVDGHKFEDVSAAAGVLVFEAEGIGADARQRAAAKALGVIVCDPDEDGWPDLIVANDTVRNFFFHNVPGEGGTRKFQEIGLRVGLGLAEGNARGGMGIDRVEFLPGKWAVVIANFANEPVTFLCQDRPKQLKFGDLAVGIGISGPTLNPLKFGTYFFDYDLDGRPDLLINNGHLEPDIEELQSGQKYAQSPQLFWNTDCLSGCFEPATATDAGTDLFAPLVGRGSAFADIDGDGDLDVVLTANNGPARVLRNENALKNHWVRFSLEGDGKRSNRSAIGAVVTLEAGGRTQTMTIAGARGYLSQSELPLTFGLGKTAKIDKVTIKWPGKDTGAPTVLTDVAVDKVHRVVQK